MSKWPTRRRAWTAAIAIFAIAVSLIQIRHVRDSPASGELLWRSNEAFLLICVNRLGQHVRLVTIPLAFVAPFGLGADDQKISTTVFSITPERVNRYVAEGVYDTFGVADGHVSSPMLRWDGDHFTPAGPGETKDLKRGFEFSNVDGWSKRSLLPGQTPPEGKSVTFDLAGEPVSLTMHRTPDVSFAIDLQRRGKPLERLWTFDERYRSTSRSEYDASFKR